MPRQLIAYQLACYLTPANLGERRGLGMSPVGETFACCSPAGFIAAFSATLAFAAVSLLVAEGFCDVVG